jgi:hypothetical protein
VSGAGGVPDLVGAVRRLGLLSAADVVDRYASRVEQALGADPSTAGGTGAGVQDVLTSLAEAVITAGRDRGGCAERLEFPPTPVGAGRRVSIWLHNANAESVRGVSVRCSELVRAGSGSAAAPAVTASPAGVDVQASGSARFDLEVSVPVGVTPGVFVGLAVPTVVDGGPILVVVPVVGDAG